MANYIENAVNYYLRIEAAHKQHLAAIRNFKHLKAAFDDRFIWIKGFSHMEITLPVVKAIPYAERLYEQKNLLFRLQSRLPFCSLPSLLWTPLEKGLPIQLPQHNFNYFGIEQTALLALTPSGREREAVAIRVPVQALQAYITTAAAVRLQPLQWLLMSEYALIIGTPLLPLAGATFWQLGNYLLATGYTLNYEQLHDEANNEVNNGDNYILWQQGTNPMLVPKRMLRPLSIDSVLATIQGHH